MKTCSKVQNYLIISEKHKIANILIRSHLRMRNLRLMGTIFSGRFCLLNILCSQSASL